MRLIPALKYYVKYWLKGMAGFFPVVILVLCMAFGVRNLLGGGGNSKIGGLDMFAMVFVFVTCLNAFREPFLLFNQNGIGRNSQYFAFAVSLVVFSVIIAVTDALLQGGLRIIFPYSSVFELFTVTGDSGISLILGQIIWEFSMFFMVGAIGYTLTSAMYRLSKWGKIAFWAGVVISLNVWTRLSNGRFEVGMPGIEGFVCAALLVGAVFMAIAYAVTRRVPVKRESAM